MTQPLVSAIVIFYNARPFLTQAVDSILHQDYPTLEVILIDDGSTDGTRELADRLAAAHRDRIRVVEHPQRANRGMSASRNLGVRCAQGQYIAFLDADDVWLPNKTREQVSILQSDPSLAMVYGRTEIWHSWLEAEADREDYFVDLGVEPGHRYDPPALLKILLPNQAQTPTTCNALVCRRSFDEVGGFEDAFTGLYEDQVFFAKIELNYPVFVDQRCWARYRQHPQRVPRRFSYYDYYRRRRSFLAWLRDYVATTPLATCADTNELIQREYWRTRHPLATSLWLCTVGRRHRE